VSTKPIFDLPEPLYIILDDKDQLDGGVVANQEHQGQARTID